jgi:hypothetical protein
MAYNLTFTPTLEVEGNNHREFNVALYRRDTVIGPSGIFFRCSRFARVFLTAAGLALNACAAHPQPVPLSGEVAVGDVFMGIRLLGTLRLPAKSDSYQGLGGLSGLAWDEDEGLLYAVSDQGKLFHLRPIFDDEKLVDVEIVTAYPLRNAKGRALKGPWADAEGLIVVNGDNGIAGDGFLIVSFERRPRLWRFSPRGEALKTEPLPAGLDEASRYQDPNKALESIALDDRWGLLTAPELPLKRQRAGYVPIIAQDGRSWSYPLYNAPRSSLVAMEALPDGSLLTLERAFVSLAQPLIVSLRRTRLPESGQETLAVRDIAVFDSSRGWQLDNFEGLTRHRGRRFFMVSDDNQHPLQRTLLIYFELVE